MEEAKCYFTPTTPHFFKPVLPGIKEKLMIPIAFLKYLNVKKSDEFDGEPRLRTDYGDLNVNIRGGFFRGEGLVDFVEHHDLENGDFLVFKHLGDLLFRVTIYDRRSSCKIKYHESEEEEDSPISGDLHESKQRKFKNPSIGGSKAEACSLRFESTLRLYSFKEPKLIIPKIFAMLHGLCEIHKVLIIDAKHEEKKWKVNVRKTDREVFFGSGWTEFRVANQLQRGDRVSFELIHKGEKPVMVFHGVIGTSRASEGREEAVNLAPQSFTYQCNQTCLAPYYELHIPKELVELIGLSRNCDVTIKDPNERHWPVSLKPTGRNSFRACQGWRDVAVANNLAIGDCFLVGMNMSPEHHVGRLPLQVLIRDCFLVGMNMSQR